MQNLRSHLAGQQVDARGESWIVLRAEPYDACTIVTLRGTGDANLGRTAELIAPFDRVSVTAPSTRVRRASRRAVLRAAATAVARAHSWLEPWTAATAHLDLLPWQLEPAMAAVGGAMRVLLADGVGLGKTIQAGLILAELRARGLVRRALILTPASLREQWAAELSDRFALDPLVLDHAALARLGAELPPDINPWSVAEIAISSIDLVKRTGARRALDAIPLDLLIVDEAHHLRPGTDRGALVEELAARVPWVVLATATPHSGDEPAYAFLRGLGALDGAEIATFRRGAAGAGRHLARRLVFHAVRATAAERTLLDDTIAYGKAIWNEHKALVAAVICRRAVSSAAALLRTLTRRRDLLLAVAEPSPLVQSELPWQENDERDAVEADGVLAAARLASTAEEIAWLDRLIALAEAVLEGGSKTSAIERLLARTNEPMVVFSEYRDTLTFLQTRFSPHATLAMIHGGLSARERRDAVQHFVNGRARVLLATDAAGEGLNLQQRCRLVVNVELPWNPLRLEQRIGRVDRLGQSRRVHAIQLVHRGSFEDTVLARFERRLHRAKAALSSSRFDDDAIAAAVLDGADITHHTGNEFDRTLDTKPYETAALRRRAVKTLTARAERTHGLYATPASRHRSVQRLAVLFECDFHDGAGHLVARAAVPLAIDLDRSAVFRRNSAGEYVNALRSCASVRELLDAFVGAQRATVAQELAQTSSALTERLRHIARGLGRSSPAPIQVSLFDKRAEQQARAGEAAARCVKDHIHRRVRAAAASIHVDATTPRLVAVWPFDSHSLAQGKPCADR